MHLPRTPFFCYDKLKDKAFARNIADIAQENSFYAIPEIERASIEKALGRIEQIYFRNPYFELIRLKNFARFPHSSRRGFFIFLAVQSIRTNQTRLEMKEMHEQTLMALAKDQGIKLPDGIVVKLKEDYAKAEHLLFVSDTNTISDYTKFLFNKKWIVCLNKTDIPLWTSDNPISYHNDFNYEGNLGTWSPGIEIRFPLSQDLLLFSYDPKVHPPKNNREKLQRDQVILSNESQIKSSVRFVYSHVNDFEIAKQYLNKYPEYRDPNRKRWKVISNHHKLEFIKI